MKEIKIDVHKMREEDLKKQAIRDNMNYWKGYAEALKNIIKLLTQENE